VPGDEVVVSQDRLFTLAMLKKLAAPFSILAFIGAATVSSAGCSSSTPTGSGGSGGAGATTTSTSSGGCAQAADCPGVDTDCSKRTCSAGVCGTLLVPAGTATSTQTAGDCKASVCDGMGMTTSKNDDADILDDSNECTDDVCADGTPENKPTMAGAMCTTGGKVCDGASKCVECVDAAACESGVCEMNKCVAASCTDKVKNVKETDVDCGGTDCNPCATGKVCVAGTDCIDTICTAGACAAPTCADTAKNGAETDVDCGGGTCAGCGPDLGCKIDGDCIGGSCSGSKCLPTCTDKVKSPNETDVDCGGPTCGGCDDTKACAVGTDCKSKICTNGACAVPSCTDLQQNGTESDVDCGGSCTPCGPTQMCSKGADCATGVCTGSVCQGAVCNDLVKNGSETDVDCGGMCATKCGTNKVCLVAADCASSVCTGGLCKAAICGDGVVNGAETCDDGNPVSGDGCSSACAVEAGFVCLGATPSVCKATCGDGLKVGSEQCDDTNTTNGDGCSSACAVEIGFTCAGAPSVCSTTCGDGVMAGTEACDDGNGLPNDGCNACAVTPGFVCTGTAPSVCTTVCGDGFKVGTEACDDGNLLPNDGCTTTCTVQAGWACVGSPQSVCTPICGDGVVTGTETCDDSNLANGDCCNSTCHIEAGCEVEPNSTTATANVYSTTQVGNKINGFLKPAATDKDYFAIVVPANAVGTLTASTVDNFLGVACTSNTLDTNVALLDSAAAVIATNDDINGTTNWCSSITTSNLLPGTYYIEVKGFGSTNFAYSLQVSLTLAICGNGIIEAPEQCDGGATCAANCTLLPVCGDGAVTSTETCEDGNTVSGDGCSSTCQVEPYFQCTSALPNVCTKQETHCSDGLDNDGDGLIDALDPDCALPAYFPACAAGQSLHVYHSVGGATAIPDNTPAGITSNLIATLGGTTQKAAILFGITHTWDSDVDMFLTAPGGAALDINTDNGSSLDNFTNTVLDSTCATAVTAGAAPFSGCYSPETSFSSLANKVETGKWSLKVADDATGDLGTLNSWSLVLCTIP
jgi:cysteine-rich repeat protein